MYTIQTIFSKMSESIMYCFIFSLKTAKIILFEVFHSPYILTTSINLLTRFNIVIQNNQPWVHCLCKFCLTDVNLFSWMFTFKKYLYHCYAREKLSLYQFRYLHTRPSAKKDSLGPYKLEISFCSKSLCFRSAACFVIVFYF